MPFPDNDYEDFEAQSFDEDHEQNAWPQGWFILPFVAAGLAVIVYTISFYLSGS